MRRKGPTSNFAIVFSVADDLLSLCLNMQLAYAKYRTLSPISKLYHHQWCKSSARKCFAMSADSVSKILRKSWLVQKDIGRSSISSIKVCLERLTVCGRFQGLLFLGTSLQHTCYIFLITGDSCQLNKTWCGDGDLIVVQWHIYSHLFFIFSGGSRIFQTGGANLLILEGKLLFDKVFAEKAAWKWKI